MKLLKLTHRIKATYKARKNSKKTVSEIIRVKAYSILHAIETAKNLLKLQGKECRFRVIDVNGTPVSLYAKQLNDL
jgi:hypothetical protein